MKQLYFFIIVVFTLSLALSTGCKKEEESTPDPNPNPDPDPVEEQFGLGLTDEDDMSKVPETTHFGFGSDNLPASYNILEKFPPIGDQGQYGTCVGWAVGYNGKTVINGIDKGYNASDLASPNKQFSAKDLFLAVDDSKKGENCGGTNFDVALQVLQDRGVATMQTVPYDNLGNCSQANLDPSWAQEAANYKIKYWRKVDGNANAIKKNISQNVPVIFGAKLADNFMTHKTDDVISSATSYDQVGQHAYHAMIIAGYDDNKGPNGAFRIVNSWGTGWGASGMAWIDYNFFFDNFLMGSGSDRTLFIAANAGGDNDPPDPDPNPTTTGVDLIPWVFGDWSTDNWEWPTERQLEFNIYNIGNESAVSSADWSYYHIYYNAFDADDYGVIFYDQFNTSIAENTYDCPTEWNCIFNIPIPAGDNFANYAWGDESVLRTYYMPEISGFYYLLTLADAEDKFQEQNEQNNLFYTTLDPLFFNDGIGLKSSGGSNFNFTNDTPVTRENIKKSKFNTVVTEDFRNAYTPEEILAFFKKEKESGRLDQKVDEYIQRNAGYVLKNKK
jgi:hypothetical protein